MVKDALELSQLEQEVCMDEFWGRHYGPARRLAWRALGWFAAAALGLVAILTLLEGAPRIVRIVVLGVGLIPVAITFVRFVIFEVRAVKALAREFHER
jgi:hypothetical protein